MGKPAPARQRRRYSWALKLKHGDPWLKWLTPEGWEGLEYARRLARNANERRRAALDSGPLPELLTVAQIARDEGVAAVEVWQRLKQARVELFGKNLSDSAIDYQLRTRDELRTRRCAEPSCDALLPPHLSAARTYCDLHRTNLAKIRRHRGHPPPRRASRLLRT
jgi:hypothetical protein